MAREKISCIYKIENINTGAIYIGSTKDFYSRIMRHIRELGKSSHHNLHLQRSFRKHTIDNFKFEVVEETKDLFERELFWIGVLSPEYNIGDVCGGDNYTRNPRKEEIRETLSGNLREYWNNLTEEGRKEISDNKRGVLNPNFGNRWSKEQREKSSAFWKEYFKNPENRKAASLRRKEYWENISKEDYRRFCDICSSKTGDKNPFYGKSHNDKTRDAISRKTKERYEKSIENGDLSKYKAKEVFVDGVKYLSLKEAERGTGVSYTTIRHRCLSDKFPNYYRPCDLD